MICRSGESQLILKPKMFAGEGTARLNELFKKGEYAGQCRLMGTLTLEPGCSVGEHTHQNDEELIFIISGRCEYSDDGVVTTLSAGDAALTVGGHSHAIRNLSNENCVYLAVVLTY